MQGPTNERAQWLADHILPHEPLLRLRLRQRGLPAAEIDDIVQECYARLSYMDSVAHIREPRAYLLRIASSLILQQVRRSRIVPIQAMARLDGLDIESPDPLPDSYVTARRELAEVSRAIAELPRQCRDVLILRRVHGLSQREVAEHMKLAETTVQKHLARAIHALSARFGRGGSRKIPGAEQDRDDSNDAGLADQRAS